MADKFDLEKDFQKLTYDERQHKLTSGKIATAGIIASLDTIEDADDLLDKKTYEKKIAEAAGAYRTGAMAKTTAVTGVNDKHAGSYATLLAGMGEGEAAKYLRDKRHEGIDDVGLLQTGLQNRQDTTQKLTSGIIAGMNKLPLEELVNITGKDESAVKELLKSSPGTVYTEVKKQYDKLFE